MIKIDFTQPFKQLDGEPFKFQDTGELIVMGKWLAKALLESKHAEPLVVFNWARKLHDTGILELEKPEAEKFRKAIDALDVIVMFKGQLIDVMIDQTLHKG
jgi:hypothetical protein